MNMLPIAHPEVLSLDWMPPVALGRENEWNRVRLRLLAGLASGSAARVAVVGPRGSGTSTVARLAARAAFQELRHSAEPGRPLLAMVRAGRARGAQGIAAELLQHLDPGFSGKGFHTTEILAGFLRRLRRERRPAIVVVDDLGPGLGDLRTLLAAFSQPDRFLPEGEEGMPPLALVLAGTTDGRGIWEEARKRGWATGDTVVLAGYSPSSIERIVRDRVARAVGRSPPDPWMTRLLDQVRGAGENALLALEVLRRRLSAPTPSVALPLSVEGPLRPPVLEPPLLAALVRAGHQRHATVAELRQWEAEFAERHGRRPLPATTFWRRIVRLESVGLVHREVRTGGAGGTRSVVELLRPLTSPTGPELRDTLPGDAWSPAGTSPSPVA